jgi:hypothetical protein
MTADVSRGFAPYNKSDRNFFLVYLALILAGIVGGFGWDVVDHLSHGKATWPIIVHIHAVFFIGWLVLLGTQIALVRSRRLDLHKRLGVAGAGLAVIMVIMGAWVAWFMDIRALGTKDADPSFLSVQLNDLILFPILVVAGFIVRNRYPSAHKRLLLLATVAISDAGFARIGFEAIPKWFGHGFWPTWAVMYPGPVLLIAAMGAYDLITRKRLHPAWIAGGALIVAGELTATWLYLTPGWKQVALKLLGQ